MVDRISNKLMSQYTAKRIPFRNHRPTAFAAYVDGRYVVYSYRVDWPIYVYDEGKWFGNETKYSKTTSRHVNAAMPVPCDAIVWMPRELLHELALRGQVGMAIARLRGET